MCAPAYRPLKRPPFINGQAGFRALSRDRLRQMLSSLKRTSGHDAARLRPVSGIARAGLVVAWVVFWLNTALFPCCEVAAAVLGGPPGNAMASISVETHAHPSGTAHSDSDASHESSCDDSFRSGPAAVGEYEIPAHDRSASEGLSIDAPGAARLPATGQFANLVFARAGPPPPSPRRLYLRTQRLLI